jgi:hypothetical protein
MELLRSSMIGVLAVTLDFHRCFLGGRWQEIYARAIWKKISSLGSRLAVCTIEEHHRRSARVTDVQLSQVWMIRRSRATDDLACHIGAEVETNSSRMRGTHWSSKKWPDICNHFPKGKSTISHAQIRKLKTPRTLSLPYATTLQLYVVP